MKLTPRLAATLVAFTLGLVSAPLHAQVVTSSGFTATSVYTDPGANDIVSFDYDASNNLYYQTTVVSDFSYSFGGFYKVPFGSSSPTTLTAASPSTFGGASVVSLGNYVYFNDGNGNIYHYNTAGGSSPSVISTTTNFGLFKGLDNSLYLTGAVGFGPNHIFHSALNGSGNLVTDPATDLGTQSGSSGPISFDASGNLYYAPGFGDLSIYKWTAAQVDAALLNPSTSPLVTNSTGASGNAQKWLDYSLIYGSFSGGTSLLIDGNRLLLTLTDFGVASDLAYFDIDPSTGNYVLNSTGVALQDLSSPLGELRLNNGNLFLSDNTQIYQIQGVPEPSTIFLLVLGVTALLGFHLRRTKRLVPVVALAASTVFFSISPAHAGPFSPAADQPGSTGVAAGDGAIKEWANGVVNFTPGPVAITNPSGAKANFGTSANALGASDSTQANPNNVVSLGDGGSITLSFATPIANGAGADFAVFENGFPQTGVPNSYFLELATVAVSSDGINFFTFPSVSLTSTSSQLPSFGTLDPTNLYNLAGSEIVGYGTPFNLDDLAGVSLLLNINNITQVRVTDVIGNINTGLGAGTYTTDDASNPLFGGLYGSSNHLINDPYPTAFNSGGFDLDAVAVLNVVTVPEPSAIGCLVLGLMALAGASRFIRGSQAQA